MCIRDSLQPERTGHPQSNSRHARKTLEAWFSTELAINRHIDFEPLYTGLRGVDLMRTQKREQHRNITETRSVLHVFDDHSACNQEDQSQSPNQIPGTINQ